eukprot:3869815-Amphidinium_carterae.1
MFWADLLLDVNTAGQLQEKYPICSILVLCIVFCPYVALFLPENHSDAIVMRHRHAFFIGSICCHAGVYVMLFELS